MWGLLGGIVCLITEGIDSIRKSSLEIDNRYSQVRNGQLWYIGLDGRKRYKRTNEIVIIKTINGNKCLTDLSGKKIIYNYTTNEKKEYLKTAELRRLAAKEEAAKSGKKYYVYYKAQDLFDNFVCYSGRHSSYPFLDALCYLRDDGYIIDHSNVNNLNGWNKYKDAVYARVKDDRLCVIVSIFFDNNFYECYSDASTGEIIDFCGRYSNKNTIDAINNKYKFVMDDGSIMYNINGRFNHPFYFKNKTKEHIINEGRNKYFKKLTGGHNER